MYTKLRQHEDDVLTQRWKKKISGNVENIIGACTQCTIHKLMNLRLA